MFDDLRDLRPPEPEGEDAETPVDDELLADLASEDELLADFLDDEGAASPPFEFDDPTMPRFGDDLDKTMAAAPAPRRARQQRLFLGMTAQQRAVLAVFLFLDVAVLGVLILLAAGAIALPIP